MIASARTVTSRRRSRPDTAWHAGFVTMLPTIVAHARIAFRFRTPEAREDAVAECVANALVAYARLVELGKENLAFPTPLAMFAVRQYRDGRRVGSRSNVNEVLSQYAQRRKRFNVASLDKYDESEDAWTEAIVEDYRTPVADQVQFRCDFPAWLNTLSRRDRRIALRLAHSENTGEVARRFKVSAGRVSQLRRELAQSWEEFTGETDGDAAA